MATTQKINEFVSKLKSTFIQVKNISTSFGQETSDDKIPSEKLVKTELDKKVDTTKIFRNGVFETKNTKSNGTVSQLWNESDGGGALIIDGTSNVKAFTGVNEGSDGSNIYVQNYAIDKDTKTGSRITVNTNGAYYTSGKSTYAFTANDEIATKGDITSISTELSSDSEVILTSIAPESEYAAAYELSQGGVSIGTINIPKDQMLRTATVKTVTSPTADETAAGLEAGDSYISLIVNTADNNSTTELIIPISELFDLQTADDTTLELNDGVYSIKDEGVDTAQIADQAVTADKIADNAITSNQLSQDLTASFLTMPDVDDEVDDYLDAIIAGLDE